MDVKVTFRNYSLAAPVYYIFFIDCHESLIDDRTSYLKETWPRTQQQIPVQARANLSRNLERSQGDPNENQTQGKAHNARLTAR